MSDPAGIPSADAAVHAVADAVAAAEEEEDVPIPMGVAGADLEEFVFQVGRRTLLLSATALIYALAVPAGGGDPTHLLLLFLLWALALALVYASTADLPRFPRGVAVAVARALHRLFWEQRR